MSSVHWTVIVQSVAALVAAGGTTGTLIVGLKTMRRQSDQIRDLEQRARRDQARRVLVWTDVDREWPRVDGDGVYRTRVAAVRNGSDAPIFDVTLRWVDVDTEDVLHTDHRPSVGAGETWEQPETMALAHRDPRLPVVALCWFFDTDGHGWQRTPRGELLTLRGAVAGEALA